MEIVKLRNSYRTLLYGLWSVSMTSIVRLGGELGDYLSASNQERNSTTMSLSLSLLVHSVWKDSFISIRSVESLRVDVLILLCIEVSLVLLSYWTIVDV